MAKNCPQCHRPNNDRATRCLYCGLLFPTLPTPAPPEKSAPPPLAPEPASEKAAPLPEAFLLTISPAQSLSGPALQKFMRIFKLDQYTALQKLKQPAPWIARAFPEAEAAQKLLAELLELGLDSYLVKQSGIDKIQQRRPVKGLARQGEEEMVFLDEQGQEVPLRFQDLFLVVRGRIKERPEREEDLLSEETPAVHLGKMAASASESENQKGRLRQVLEKLPAVRPRPTRLRWVLRGQVREILDLYLKSSPHALRLEETDFDYSGLGPNMSPSGLLNFVAILNTIKSRAPHAIFDASFNLVGNPFPENMGEDQVRTDLLRELGISQSKKRIYNNLTFFNDYSARLYLHYLREKKQVPATKIEGKKEE